jgi:hypothetical protein
MAVDTSKQADKLRAWWWHRQGLVKGAEFTSPAAVLKQSGWARSVGGCGPYVALFSRGGFSRESVDNAVAKIEIHELPSARGCTYVVPAEDYTLALRLAQEFGSADLRVAEKLGVTTKEIEKLRQAVLRALEKGPLGPDGIREATGGAARSLGAEGQKKGMSSTLPLALGQLQRSGDIRRISTNGRLDQQRYLYALWRPNPFGKQKLDLEVATLELARRFFAWIGPAPVTDFQTFAGVSLKAAKNAVAALKLEPVAGIGDDLLLPAELHDEFDGFEAPKKPDYRLLIGIDSLLLLHRDMAILFDPKHVKHSLVSAKAAGGGAALTEVSSPVIVDRGRIVGFWEYDPEKQEIAFAVFGEKDAALNRAVAETEEYVRTQLEDARTFSLDSPKSRAPRIAALRKAAGR